MASLRKIALWVFALSLFLTGQEAVWAKETHFDLNLGLGYRIDRLDWNIAGVTSPLNPINVVSELTWDDIRIQQLKGGGRFIVEEIEPAFALYLRGFAGYGQIVEGENQDSDFAGNNRTLEFSRSNNDANDGHVLDGSIGIGLQKKKKLKGSAWVFKFAPLVGYAYHEQHLKMVNGLQTVSRPDFVLAADAPLSLGPFFGLDSSYETEWQGPWIGLDLSLEMDKTVSLFGLVEYHWPDYTAQANWNLRPDFAHPVSFSHVAEGQGLLASLGWKYRFLPGWAVHVALEYLDWSTDRGTDINFLADGSIGVGCLNPDGSLRLDCLNTVNWESKSLTLAIAYRFD